jgi:hypothetical protein
MRIKVIAIDNSKIFAITKGKMYETDRPVNERQVNYSIRDDKNRTSYVPHELFILVDEFRDSQIEKILEK